MFNFLFIIAIVIVIYNLLKEAFEKPAPPNQRFDYEAYQKDIMSNMGIMEQNEKIKRGGYYTTKPIEKNYTDVVDVQMYDHDWEVYGAERTEMLRRDGFYKRKRMYFY